MGNVDGEPPGGLSPAGLAELLTDQRPRYALYYLEACEYAVTVAELVKQVAVWETELAANAIPDEVFEEIQTEFSHSHLPELAASSVIAYDEEHELVTRSENTDYVGTYLHRLAAQDQ